MHIYLLLITVLFLYTIIVQNINKTRKRQKYYILFAFGMFILIACLRSSAVGRDLAGHYAINYQYIADLSWEDLAAFSNWKGYEIGFVLYCKILSVISGNPQFFICVTSIFILGIHGRFIYKYSEDVVISTMIFVLSCTYYMYLTMLRQAMAVSILLIGFEFLLSNKIRRGVRYSLFVFINILSAMFHQAALLCIIVVVLDMIPFRRIYAGIIAVGSGFIFVFYSKIYLFVLMFMGNKDRYASHVNSIEGMGSLDKITLINIFLTMAPFILGYIAFSWHTKNARRTIIKENDNVALLLSEHDNLFLFLCLLAGICRLLMIKMNILNRMSYYFMPFVIIYYPRVLQHTVKFREPVKYVIYLLYILYFFFMTVFLAGEYYGVVPYYFFWQ